MNDPFEALNERAVEQYMDADRYEGGRTVSDRIEAIREREGKATPGPWVRGLAMFRCTLDHGRGPGGHGRGDCKYEFQCLADDAHLIASVTGVQVAGNYDYEEGGIITEGDAEFIAHAREDIPYLLEEVARLEGEKERLQQDYNDIEMESRSWEALEVKRLEGESGQWSKLFCAEVDRAEQAEAKVEKVRAALRQAVAAEVVPSWVSALLATIGEGK